MKQGQKGFTMIELIVVIVILGILAATALPKFIDLKSDASSAATAGVAGALSSGAAVNYGARKANPAKGVAIANCTDVASTLQGGALPNATYSITAAAVAVDASVNCTLNGPNATTATFTAIGIN